MTACRALHRARGRRGQRQEHAGEACSSTGCVAVRPRRGAHARARATRASARRSALLLLHARLDASTRATELLLMLADRAQHVAEVDPTRARARARSSCATASRRRRSRTRASAARSASTRSSALSAFAAGGLEPDLVVVLDLPDDVADARVARRPRSLRTRRRRVPRRGPRRVPRRSRRTRGWALVDAQRHAATRSPPGSGRSSTPIL